MDKIKINTGLDGFILVDSISKIEDSTIQGTKDFTRAPAYLGIESLAQLGALHVRFITGFERHAFLLKIIRCEIPETGVLTGKYLLDGTLINRSGLAFSYRLRAEKENEAQIKGEFLYATVDYDNRFKKERLKQHYQKVFSCLQSASKTGCCPKSRQDCTEIRLK